MSWLRIDDGMPEHRKLLALPVELRWALVEVWAWCARAGTAGAVSVEVLARYGFDAAAVEELERLALLDVDADGGLHVHDWAVYNGAKTGAQRTAEWRDRKYGAARYSHGGVRGAYEPPVPGPPDSAPLRQVRDEGRMATSSAAIRPGVSQEGEAESGLVTSSVTGETSPKRHHVRAESPSPSPEKNTSELQDGARDLDFGGAIAAARLLAELGGVDPDTADTIRGLAARAPEAALARCREALRSGGVRDRVAYVITTLRNEAK